MAINITSPVTGGVQTGLTAPTYNLVADTPPDINGKQQVVVSLGGTQVGVDAHSVARPFTVSVFRPKLYSVLGKPNPTTGLISSVGRNIYKVLTRKGVTPLVNQPSQPALIRTEIEVPAGSDIADPANLRAMISLHVGALQQISAGLGDTAVNGVL